MRVFRIGDCQDLPFSVGLLDPEVVDHVDVPFFCGGTFLAVFAGGDEMGVFGFHGFCEGGAGSFD